MRYGYQGLRADDDEGKRVGRRSNIRSSVTHPKQDESGFHDFYLW